ncbi:MAG TPA: hypothetical protein VNC78_01000 [Actinomycetota bacterium]|nr:hypothetical protein [Actinomycetota bacterium]
MRRHRAAAVALAAILGLSGMVACDNEDKKDIEEIGNEIEDVGEDIEQEIDEADTDGKDD